MPPGDAQEKEPSGPRSTRGQRRASLAHSFYVEETARGRVSEGPRRRRPGLFLVKLRPPRRSLQTRVPHVVGSARPAAAGSLIGSVAGGCAPCRVPLCAWRAPREKLDIPTCCTSSEALPDAAVTRGPATRERRCPAGRSVGFPCQVSTALSPGRAPPLRRARRFNPPKPHVLLTAPLTL